MASKREKPKVEIPNLGKDLVIGGLFCKHCAFFQREGIYEFDKDKTRERTPCHNLGVQPNSKPCPNFSVNPYEFDFNEVDGATALLSELFRGLDERKLPQFAAHLMELYKTRKKGFKFGETVYVRLFGDEYVSNYAAAKVIKVKETIERPWTGPSLDPAIQRRRLRQKVLVVYAQGAGNLRMQLKAESVLREKEFAARLKIMQKAGRLIDPQYARYSINPIPPVEDLGNPGYRPSEARVIQQGKIKQAAVKKSSRKVAGRTTATNIPPKHPSGRERRDYESRRFTKNEVKAFHVQGK